MISVLQCIEFTAFKLLILLWYNRSTMTDDNEVRYTVDDIVTSFVDVTASRVTAIIKQLGLLDSDVHCKSGLDGSDNQVSSMLYSKAAADLIKRELRSRGHRLCDVDVTCIDENVVLNT